MWKKVKHSRLLSGISHLLERSTEISDVRRDVINEAWKYYGGEYVWGGEVLGEGVDCSGFVLRLYEQFGVFLHRVSAEQAGDGTEVSLSQMKPGDLIFTTDTMTAR